MNLNDSWDLPRFNGNVVLGTGESAPNKAQAIGFAEVINEAMTAERTYQSWILTDHDEGIYFSVDDGKLEISGEPHFYFWRSDSSSYEIDREYHRIRSEALKLVIEREKSRAETLHSEHRALVDQRNAAAHDANALRSDTSENAARRHAELTSRIQALDVEIDDKEERIRALNEEIRSLVDQANEIIGQSNELKPEVIELEELTEDMKARREALREFNPSVYGAAQRVMRFAAFFRYVRRTNNQSWLEFFSQLNNVKIEPVIRTPTRIPRPQPNRR
jgi:hypothetical protein